MNAPVPDPSLAEQGRRLASQREDLIAQGADPRELLIPLHPGTPTPCPTCQNGRTRETTGMVCQTCGRDYGTGATTAAHRAVEAYGRRTRHFDLRAHPTLVIEGIEDALAAALDVDEMARSVADDLYGQNVTTLMARRPGESRRDQAERIGAWAAGVIGAAILGDDRGEADPGLLLILLGAGLAVLGSAAALAIVAGLLG